MRSTPLARAAAAKEAPNHCSGTPDTVVLNVIRSPPTCVAARGAGEWHHAARETTTALVSAAPPPPPETSANFRPCPSSSASALVSAPVVGPTLQEGH